MPKGASLATYFFSLTGDGSTFKQVGEVSFRTFIADGAGQTFILSGSELR